MKILIIGGSGMVGRKLMSHMLMSGFNDIKPSEIFLFDYSAPGALPDGVNFIKGDLLDNNQIAKIAKQKFDVIFHLAAIVSGEAEEEFLKGWNVNMFSMWNLLEAIRQEHLSSSGAYVPKIIFTSSIAVFGAPFPERIDDEFFCSPQTSYGAQKVCAEIMLSDFSRKGFVDGVSIRLPTICVRPGAANKAASSFFSGIIREPLNGEQAILPVEGNVRHWHASPRSAAKFLMHAANMKTSLLENRRCLNLPGVSCTVDEQIEALRSVAGQDAVNLIKPVPDPKIIKMVSGWPRDFKAERAIKLGFEAEKNFEEIISVYIADDLDSRGGEGAQTEISNNQRESCNGTD